MEIVSHVVKFNSQTTGRDKLCRLFQYGSKFAWWHFEKHGFDKELIQKFKNLESSLSSTRKVLRFGKSLDMIQSAYKNLGVSDILVKALLVVAKLNQAMYLFLDHFVWMTKTGLIKGDSKKLAKRAAKFWLITIIANLLRNAYDILTIIMNEKHKQKMAAKKRNNDRAVAQQGCANGPPMACAVWKNKPVVVDTVKNLCDLWLPLCSIGVVNFSAGFQGLMGLISSYMGILAAWNPALKLSPS